MKHYAAHYDGIPVSSTVYREWNTTNVQLICGTKTPGASRIVVIDLDGIEARDAWKRLSARYKATHKTWIALTGGGGVHIYYTIPESIESVPSGVIWGLWDTFGGSNGNEERGGWAKHKRIEILGDRSLVVAPPSIHVKTGNKYQWVKDHGPVEYHMPADMPDWLLEFERPEPTNRTVTKKEPVRPPMQKATFFGSHLMTTKEIAVAIPEEEKIGLVKSWGLRLVVNEKNADGWMKCKALDREDQNPSAAFAPEGGWYYDKRDNVKLSLFDLGEQLGAFSSWQDCRDWCYEVYIQTQAKSRVFRG